MESAPGNETEVRHGARSAEPSCQRQTTQETRVRSLGREGPLEEEMAAHSRVPAWRSPGTGEPGGLQSTGRKETRRKRLSLHAQDTPLGGVGGTLVRVSLGEGPRTVTAMWTGLMGLCPPSPSPPASRASDQPRGKDPDFAFGSLSSAGRRESCCGDWLSGAVEGIWSFTMPSLGAAQTAGIPPLDTFPKTARPARRGRHVRAG